MQENKYGNFPGSPVVEISPSNPEGLDLILVRELRSHMPRGRETKTYNGSNRVTNSMKTLKMAHVQKKSKKKRNTRQKRMSHGNTVWRGSGGLLLNQEIIPCSGLAHPFTPPRRAHMLSAWGFDVFWAGRLRVPHGRGTAHWENGKRQRNGSKGQWDHPERVSGGAISGIWVSVSRNLIQQVRWVFKE